MHETWEDHFELNIIYIILNFVMWFAYYSVHFTEPGYLKQNTVEYQNALRNVNYFLVIVKTDKINNK